MPSTAFPISHARFQETHWTLVQQAASRDGDAAGAALEALFSSYRTPLYSFLRKRGFPSADAEDLMQGFFLHVMQREALSKADRAKGRFRSFLLTSLKNYLANEFDRQHTLKRGGGIIFVPIDQLELFYREITRVEMDPEKVFDRAWAVETLQRALAQLEADYRAQNRLDLFRSLQPLLSGQAASVSYAGLSAELGKSEESIRMATSRLRRRFRELLHREILKTVSTPADVDEELRHLFSCL